MAFSASPLRSTTPMTIEPKTLISEQPPHPLGGSRCERRTHQLDGVPGPLPHPVAYLLAA